MRDTDDLIRHLMREIALAAPLLSRDALLELELRLRARFGGQRHYVRKQRPTRPRPG